MSHVKAFATGIKIESALFGGRSRDQGDLRIPKLTGRGAANGCLTLCKSLRKERSNDQAHFLRSKALIPVANASTGDISDYPLF